MKPLLTHLIVVLFFIPLTLAQDFNALHFQLEEVTNPNAFLRTGNIRSVDNDTQLQAGTWGSGTFARAIALKTNDESQVVWAFRLNFTLPGSTNAQASYG